MTNGIFIALLNNAILLLALAAIYDLVISCHKKTGNNLFRKIFTGFALGGLGISLMLAALRLSAGIIFDTRSVLLSMSGLFFGAIPTVIAMAVTAAFRCFQGGAAAWAGVAVIVFTGTSGILWQRLRRTPPENISAGELYIFGIFNHVAMLALMFIMPAKTALPVVSTIALPVMCIYPLVTVVLGLLLASRIRRQRMAEALSESESTYRNLFQHTHAVMLLIDPFTGTITDANPAASRFYRWTTDELCQMNISQISLIPPDKLKEELRKNLTADTFLSKHRLADRTTRDVEVLTGPVTISGKRHIYYFIQDISERSRQEIDRQKMLADAEQSRKILLSVIEDQKLTETKLQRLSTAIEQSPETVVITDPDGIIQYVNPAFETTTGYSLEEAVGENPRVLKSGQHDERFYADLWKTISSGSVWEGRITNKRKNGELYTEEASISPVRDVSGTVTGYVAVKRDITQELQREEQFRQSQKMEAVGQLAGGIAHDFNNILQAVLGFSELLLNRLQENTPEHRNAFEIQKAARRAADLTGQLLAFSRKQPVERKKINLNTAIRDAEVLLHMLLGDNTECIFELSPDLLPVYADHNQITQILINLSVNARDAMPNGGRLTVTTDMIMLDRQTADAIPDAKPGKFIRISITDTGCGMSPEVKEHLFEPFFTTKAVGQGTGLGLAVVYGIVKQSKGWIHVSSEQGHGTGFRIYLPAAEESGPDKTEKHSDQRRILLVEDDADVRSMVVQILKSAGYEPVDAASAEEALRLIEEQGQQFDLLFSDIVLPNQNGIDLADMLRLKNKNLPVLLFSSYRDQRERWEKLDSKGYAFLQKPFSLTGLLAAVHDALETR